jgi:hypothetical protein
MELNGHGQNRIHMWDTSVIFKELPKVNNHPFGENLPNLAILDAKRSPSDLKNSV